jgi:hypothetical protein
MIVSKKRCGDMLVSIETRIKVLRESIDEADEDSKTCVNDEVELLKMTFQSRSEAIQFIRNKFGKKMFWCA